MQKDIWDFFRHNMIYSFDICQIAQPHKEMTQGAKVRYGEVSSRLGVFSGFFLGGAFYLLA
jgi:hypothetical protein